MSSLLFNIEFIKEKIVLFLFIKNNSMKFFLAAAVLILRFFTSDAQPKVATNFSSNFSRLLNVASSYPDSQITANTSNFNIRVDSIPDFIAVSNFRLQNRAGIIGTPGTTNGGTGTSLVEDMRGLAPYASGTFFTDRDKLRWLNGDSFVTQTRYTSPGSSFMGIEQIDLPGAQYSGTSLGLVIADADLHRFLITDLNGNVLDSIGSGVSGSVDGNFETAQFMAPAYISENNQGSHQIFVTDTLAHTVKMIDISARTVTTIVDGQGYVDGDYDDARCDTPMGIVATLDGSEIYFVDAGNDAIRKVDIQTGIVSTVAGGNGSGFSDGDRLSSQLNRPRGIDIDFLGNLFFSDVGNHAIRQLTIPSHEVITLVGNGTSGVGANNARDYQSQLSFPNDVKFMVNNNTSSVFYIADQGNNLIKRGVNETFIRNVRPTTTGDIGYHKIAFTAFNNGGEDRINFFVSVKSGDIPTVNFDQVIPFPENEMVGALLGQVSVTNPNSATLTNWEIVEGNPDLDNNSTPTFSIDASGQILINEADGYDFEILPNSFELFVTVSDGTYFAPPTPVTLELINLPPVITSGQNISVDENTTGAVGTPQVVAEPLQVLQNWTIVSGNIDADGDNMEAFVIDPNTGEISTSDVDELDFENITSFTLGITVEDGDTISAVENYTIDLNNLNDTAPSIPSGQVFTADEGFLGSIGDIVVTDPDGDPIVSGSYSVYLDNKNDPISFDPDNDGQFMLAIFPSLNAPNYPVALSVTDNDDFDYEIEPTIKVVVTFGDGTFTTQDTVTINLNNLNDEFPVISPSQSFTIDENSAQGSTVGIPSATDPDGVTTFSSWSIVSGNDDVDLDSTPPFEINANTGEITVTDPDDLDAENQLSFTLGLIVSDGLNTSQVETVQVDLSDINEFAPAFVSGGSYSIDEDPDLSVGQLVGTISATDEDLTGSISYRIDPNSIADPDNDGNLPVAINASTGEITVNDTDDMDFELLSSVLTVPFHFFNVIASDGTLETTSNLLQLIVANKNDEAPIVLSNQAFVVDENTADETLVGQVVASGRDAGLATDFQNWVIISGNTDNDGDGNLPFSIIDNDNDGTGDLEVNDTGDLDFETATSFNLEVVVNDGGLPGEDGFDSAPEIVTITLNNLNDNAPVISSTSLQIDENSADQSLVGSITAADADGTTTFSSWTIISGNEDVDQDSSLPFAIDTNSGEITVADAGDLDAENRQTFTLELSVSDGLNTSEVETVEITLSDVNEFAPVFTVLPSYSIDEDPNLTVGESVGFVSATDEDFSGTIAYSILASNFVDPDNDGNLPLAINSSTGEITINDVDDMDFELLNSELVIPFHFFNVVASDGSLTTTSSLLQLVVVNTNDQAPIIAADQSFSIDENAEDQLLVGQVEADGRDAGLSVDFQGWTITSGNNDTDNDGTPPFMIVDNDDDNRGDLIVSDSDDLDFETAESFSLSIVVNDGGLASETGFDSAPQTVVVNLNNLNDNVPVVSPGTFQVDENSTTQTVIGAISTSDPDGATTFQFEVTNAILPTDLDVNGNGEVPFSISETGQIVIEDASDFDRELVEKFEFEVTANDGSLTSEKVTISIDVLDVNEFAPEVNSATILINENEVAGYTLGTLTATDQDINQNFSNWTIVSGNPDDDNDAVAAFTISSATGEVQLADPDDLIGNAITLIVTVSDGDLVSQEQGILIEVNNAPIILGTQSSITLEANESFEVFFDDLFDDPNDDELYIGSSLINSTELPDWMAYDSVAVRLSGQAPELLQEALFEILVTAQDSLGLSISTSFDIVVNPRPLAIADESLAIKIYPNPVAEFISIELNSSEKVEMNIIDETGRTIWKKDGTFSKIEADLSSISDGIYFLKVRQVDKGREQSFKIVKRN